MDKPNRIKALRRAQGWRQADLAKRLGVSRQTLNGFENGKYGKNLRMAFGMARLFGESVEHIFRLEPDDHPSPEKLAGYLVGRLEESEQESVNDHLGVCRACVRAVLELASFPDVVPGDPKDELSAKDALRRWEEQFLPGSHDKGGS